MISENNDFSDILIIRFVFRSLFFPEEGCGGASGRVPLSAEEASGGGGGFAPERCRLLRMERVDESVRRSVRAESA